MSWRSIVITKPCRLALKSEALSIDGKDGKVRVPLEDVAVIVLDQVQVTLTAPVLSACADRNIALITVNNAHHPNGVLVSFLPHSRALKTIRAQLGLSKARRKRIWQGVVKRKVLNQAEVLQRAGHMEAARRLTRLARGVQSGDKGNTEAHAAQLYFPALFGTEFTRKKTHFYNSVMNYGYSIVRAGIARQLVAYGFVTAIGLHHSSEQNQFNLADDLLEPFRPIIDQYLLDSFKEPDLAGRDLQREEKGTIVELLNRDVMVSDSGTPVGQYSVLSAIEQAVVSLSQRLGDGGVHLSLPSLGE